MQQIYLYLTFSELTPFPLCGNAACLEQAVQEVTKCAKGVFKTSADILFGPQASLLNSILHVPFNLTQKSDFMCQEENYAT